MCGEVEREAGSEVVRVVLLEDPRMPSAAGRNGSG